jgi:hypothetical protein
MVSPPRVLRNAEGAQIEGRAREGYPRSAAKGIIEAGARKPRPVDDSYSYQSSPEPSQYSAFDNTH